MRLTLVKPPEQSDLNFGVFSLAVLAGAVRDIADVKILDASCLSITEATKEVLQTQPESVGITTMGFESVSAAGELVYSLRKSGFSGKLLVGGHGAAMAPEPLLKKGSDAVVYGEGELTLREVLLRGVLDDIPGLILFRNGQLLKTPPRPLISPLNILPEPARDLADSPSNGLHLLETSRGCPHTCAFCEATRFHRGRWRGRSPEIVVRDVRRLVRRYGATIIQIVDDNFTANPERAMRISELLQEGPLPLFFIFSTRSDDLLRNSGLVGSLANTHFLRANVGVETVVPEIAELIKKPVSFEDHKRAFEAMRNVGIYTVASFIVGLPGETKDMRQEYVEAAVKLGGDSVRFLPFQPFPGIPLGDGSGKPDPKSILEAERLTREFERNPKVLERLLDAAEQRTVRGMLARASLNRRLREDILDPGDAALVAEKLRCLEEREVTV